MGANKTRGGVWWFCTVIARLELQFLEFPSLHTSRLGAQENCAKDLNSRNEAVAIFSIFKRVSIRSELVTSMACGSTWTYNSSCCQITLGKQRGMQLLCDLSVVLQLLWTLSQTVHNSTVKQTSFLTGLLHHQNSRLQGNERLIWVLVRNRSSSSQGAVCLCMPSFIHILLFPPAGSADFRPSVRHTDNIQRERA